jgi:hypothetical protein
MQKMQNSHSNLNKKQLSKRSFRLSWNSSFRIRINHRGLTVLMSFKVNNEQIKKWGNIEEKRLNRCECGRTFYSFKNYKKHHLICQVLGVKPT